MTAPWYNAILKWFFPRSFRPVSETHMQVWDGLHPVDYTMLRCALFVASMISFAIATAYAKNDWRYCIPAAVCFCLIIAHDIGAQKKKQMPPDRVVPVGPLDQ